MYVLFGKPRSIIDLNISATRLAGIDRSKVRICVIDDEGFEYMETIRNHDFNLKSFADIEDIKVLETYDIVLSDIRGVGKIFKSKFEGAHMIAEIRKHYPFKYIIAYSGHSFDPSYNQFFQIADKVLKKDVDTDTWIESLDEAMKSALNPLTQWLKIRNYLLTENVPLSAIIKLEDEYVATVIKQQPRFPSTNALKPLSTDIRGVLQSFAGSILFKLLIGS